MAPADREPETGERATPVTDALFKARAFMLGTGLALAALALFAIARDGRGAFFLVWFAGEPFVVLTIGAYALLRSVRLAMLAALVPVLALLWALGAIVSSGPPDPFALLAALAMFAAGIGIALQTVHAIATETCRGMSSETAARAGLARAVKPGTLALLAGFASTIALALLAMKTSQSSLAAAPGIAMLAREMLASLAPAALTGLCLAFGCFVLLPLAASYLAFDEAFIARANRARESYARWLAPLAGVSVPRWAFAILGIAAVLLAISLFGGPQREGAAAVPRLWGMMGLPLAAVTACAGLIGGLGLRDWRAFFVCAAPPFVASALGGAAAVALGLAPGPAALNALMFAGAAGAAFCYFVAVSVAAYRRFGDSVTTAFSRTLGGAGMVTIFAGVTLAALMLASAFVVAGEAAAAVMPLFQAPGALILAPAIMGALDELFPHRRSLEELYGAR